MVYGVLSDVHSNLEGLRAVLDQMRRLGVDRILFLGDAVGYGADPNECVRLLSRVADAGIRGNHDRAVAGADYSMAYSRNEVRVADVRNRELMDAECLDWVRSLEPGPMQVDDVLLMCHGSPRDEDEYLMSYGALEHADARVRESYPGVAVCLFGHTHVAMVVENGRRTRGRSVELDPGQVYLVNPGSVGQPRDGDPRASFGVVDTTARVYRNHRVAYDTEEARRKIIRAGLPRVFADRLGVGR